ncbi:maleylpyruvate isomerase family mycothiol-dependent enzyme [Aestuariimicrobium soli]|uniref:maleylpyruvate isomerase family mycothiol-dependent enzyme n=1 Tax=Aestuariimicrobium soli TaxID=2035834 RepID=UPI003EBFCF1C
MSHAPVPPPEAFSIGGSIADVRPRKAEMTQRLLGETIRLSEKQWQEPSLLPGWTRAHVATHIARNADGMARSLDALVKGRPQRMYTSEADRQSAIERGSQRSGLDLQIDLDTSAGNLNRVFDALEDLDPEMLIELRAGFRIPVRLLPLARLNEVVLHHVDLDVGFAVDQIPQPVARWLVEWTLLRLHGREDVPGMHLTSTSGLRTTIPGMGDTLTVRGTDQDLLGWLTGRAHGEALQGTGGMLLPLLG